MSTEVVSLVVAFAGVFGTLSATFITQRAALRTKQLDSEDRRRERAEERAESERHSAQQDKHTQFAELNVTAHRLRSLAHHCVVERHCGREVDLAEVDSVRAAFREVNARTQMILSDRALKVADEVNHGLAIAFQVAHEGPDGLTSDTDAFERFHRWMDDSLQESVRLLRHVLREDLGVIPQEGDVDRACRQLATERAQAYDRTRYLAMLSTPNGQQNTDPQPTQ